MIQILQYQKNVRDSRGQCACPVNCSGDNSYKKESNVID